MMGLRIHTPQQQVLIYGSFPHSYLNKFITTLFIYNYCYKLTLQELLEVKLLGDLLSN
jgi:hypothetical protein